MIQFGRSGLVSHDVCTGIDLSGNKLVFPCDVSKPRMYSIYDDTALLRHPKKNTWNVVKYSTLYIDFIDLVLKRRLTAFVDTFGGTYYDIMESRRRWKIRSIYLTSCCDIVT